MARRRKRRPKQAGTAGATQPSQERQVGRDSPGTPTRRNKCEGESGFICQISPQRNHGNADINPTTHVHDAHDNDVHAEHAVDDNNDNDTATDGDAEVVDDDKNEGQAGDQPPEVVDDEK